MSVPFGTDTTKIAEICSVAGPWCNRTIGGLRSINIPLLLIKWFYDPVNNILQILPKHFHIPYAKNLIWGKFQPKKYLIVVFFSQKHI